MINNTVNELEIECGIPITTSEVYAVAFNPHIKVKLSNETKKSISQSREVVEKIVSQKKVVYGVTTGFGSFKDKYIVGSDSVDLQKNLIRSHACGVGAPLSKEAVRAALLVRLISLSQGCSGVRLELLEAIANLLNEDVTPFVPSQGSVGSSGDLAPLSHIGLVLIGEGKAFYKEELLESSEALRRAHLSPIDLKEKEGLAINNGTSVMTGIAAVCLHRAENLLKIADLACALSLEAVSGLSSPYDARVHEARPYKAQILSAKRIRQLISGSSSIDSFLERVQDSYSLRCAPQVHGAAGEAISYVGTVVGCEINSVTDNPLIFRNPDISISAGNFHGEPVAIAMDTLGIALAELANISERRIAKLIDPHTNGDLPIFLISKDKAGLHSGLMIPQYVAASLVSENKVLAHPASVDSIPTSVNQEDHVSMGTIAARKAMNILENAENVLAIELLTSAQAIDFRGKEKLAPLNRKAYELIRNIVPYISEDRILNQDIASLSQCIKNFYFEPIFRELD